MKLITAHRILIAAGIAFFALYALLQGRQFFMRGAGAAAAVQVVLSVGVVVGLAIYYRSLKRWGSR
ncbi:MAG: hypothetical protein FJ027_21505 [Candidatus Rokubacteria bacterium]|nr:hypothetical protein [Candidatus Rokubacteria bacterium]